MRSYIRMLVVAVIGCAGGAVGGFAVGGYIQFMQTVLGTQGTLMRDLAIAKGVSRNESSEDLMKWMKADVPLQYQFLATLAEVRSQPLPRRLATVARMTWNLRSMPPERIRSPEQLQMIVRNCGCGVALAPPPE